MDGVQRFTDPLSKPFKSAFLTDVLLALAKTRKAIRHKVRQLAVEKVLEHTDGDHHEKLEICCEVGAREKIRLFLWDDRWVFVDARTPTKDSGWKWEFTHQGRLGGGSVGRALVQAFEQSIEAAADQSADGLGRVWMPLLASGPRLVS